MTGSPLKLTLEHSLKQLNRNRRQDFMGSRCRTAPVVLREGDNWREVSFPMCDEMPYQVNRFEFSESIQDRTDGMFHCLSLARGVNVRVTASNDVTKTFVMQDCDTIILPACFGRYICENLTNGPCEIIKTFLRKVDF